MNLNHSKLTQAAAVGLDARIVLEHGARNAHIPSGDRAVRRCRRPFAVLLVAACGTTSLAHAQTDFLAPSERAPLTKLPTCAQHGVVEACFDFERGTRDDWRLATPAPGLEHAHGVVDLASNGEPRGGRSLRISAEFSSTGWSSVTLELRADVSLTEYAGMRATMLAPEDTALHLAVRFAINAGPSWEWFEAKDALPLDAGAWSVVEVPLETEAWVGPHGGDHRSWTAYLREVHKIVVRIEASPDWPTRGPAVIAIDDIWFPRP